MISRKVWFAVAGGTAVLVAGVGLLLAAGGPGPVPGNGSAVWARDVAFGSILVVVGVALRRRAVA